ncbi:HprK-related kinase A [Halochromatium roseum]|uniref:HprK-related kinase A n=1 Tax=Halochromatium roseum TaxID=391920 RepID=UPI001913C05D|nr:HprK-related kinase A [Halochromatium roseum]MBK5940381.1 HprK-related kinase A [Halochromatium roseum]
MKLGTLEQPIFAQKLARAGIAVRFGPLQIRLRTAIKPLAGLLHHFWRDFPLVDEPAIIDCHLAVSQHSLHRRWPNPELHILVDGRAIGPPFPRAHHFPMLEWGVNFCLARRANHLLILHAAVIERHGLALLLPAIPGHGKSTLCAALIHSGWRLLSDEFGLVRPEDGLLLPVPRSLPLKNASIDVIRAFAPQADLGPSFEGTHKGTVAHVRPPSESVQRMDEPARPRWVVFPRWVANSRLRLEPVVKPDAFLMVATNAFNYNLLGQTAFELVGQMVDACECYTLVYSDLKEAMAALNELTDSARA